MAKLNKEELARIVERDLPGYRVSRQSKVEGDAEGASGLTRAADASGAADSYGGAARESSLARKYLGADAADEETATDSLLRSANPGRHNDSSAGNDDEEIVAVEPESASHPWDRGARPKAVVIKNKKIIGMQG